MYFLLKDFLFLFLILKRLKIF